MKRRVRVEEMLPRVSKRAPVESFGVSDLIVKVNLWKCYLLPRRTN
jgi:Uri superfamily endonuclease